MVKLLIVLVCLFGASVSAQTTSTRARQQAIREHEERIHRITEEAKARREGRPYIPTSAPLASRAATTSTREERIKAHQDRIQSIIEASKARREGRPYIPTSAPLASRAATTSTREERIKAHQDRMQSIIEASRYRKAQGLTTGTRPLDQSETQVLRNRIDAYRKKQEASTSSTDSLSDTISTAPRRQFKDLPDQEKRKRIQDHQDRIQNIIDESALRKLEQTTTNPR